MSNQTDTNQASEVKRNSLNKSDRDVKLESINHTGGRTMSTQSYAEWLLKDQCKGLLNMTNADIAKVLGVSRPTVDVYLADASKMTARKIDRLVHHLEFVKAAILTTEAEL